MNRLTRTLLAIEASETDDIVLGPLVLPLTTLAEVCADKALDDDEQEGLADEEFAVALFQAHARIQGYEVIQFRDHVLGVLTLVAHMPARKVAP